jgi:hypothetical protein
MVNNVDQVKRGYGKFETSGGASNAVAAYYANRADQADVAISQQIPLIQQCALLTIPASDSPQVWSKETARAGRLSSLA